MATVSAPLAKLAEVSAPSAPRVEVDDLDLALLRALATDARQSQRALARKIEMSPPAVADRLARLERSGAIRGYRVDIDWAALGFPVVVYLAVTAGPGMDLSEIITAIWYHRTATRGGSALEPPMSRVRSTRFWRAVAPLERPHVQVRTSRLYTIPACSRSHVSGVTPAFRRSAFFSLCESVLGSASVYSMNRGTQWRGMRFERYSARSAGSSVAPSSSTTTSGRALNRPFRAALSKCRPMAFG